MELLRALAADARVLAPVTQRAPARHSVHVDDSQLGRLPELVARSSMPLGVGPVLTVDTTVPVDIPALAGAVRARLP